MTPEAQTAAILRLMRAAPVLVAEETGEAVRYATDSDIREGRVWVDGEGYCYVAD